LLLWIDTLSILCLFLDPELEPIQRWGQTVFIILIPFFGAALVLKLVKDHSPDVIGRFYIPWPFRGLVEDKPLRNSGTGARSGTFIGQGGFDGGGSDGGGGSGGD
jgi:uncharacterized membrane protein YgcG